MPPQPLLYRMWEDVAESLYGTDEDTGETLIADIEASKINETPQAQIEMKP